MSRYNYVVRMRSIWRARFSQSHEICSYPWFRILKIVRYVLVVFLGGETCVRLP